MNKKEETEDSIWTFLDFLEDDSMMREKKKLIEEEEEERKSWEWF
jgi:hypothetical protein